ncbi:MAG: TRAP transporter small permease [Firmicutes bacterium]|nr:TRAP transporter small permease [Bacillota bacterium]
MRRRRDLIAYLDTFEAGLSSLTAVLMIVLSAFVTYQVFARYVLRRSPFWVEELSVIAMMWIGLLGAAGCVWTDSHMSMEFIRAKLPPVVRAWLRFCTDLILTAFAGLLGYYGIALVRMLRTATLATLAISRGHTYFVVPVAGFLMAFFGLVRAFTRLVTFYHQRGGKTDA